MIKDISSLHDFELIDKVIVGNDACYSELVKRHQSLVATTAVNMVGDIDDARDIGQMVFIRFYNSIASFKKEAKLSTYLTRITINLSLNHLKRRKKFSDRSNNLDVVKLKPTQDFVSDIESKELVNLALQRLEDHHKSIIVLRMIQGYSTLETAEILDIPKGTVLSRLKRAMDKLKIILTNEFDYER